KSSPEQRFVGATSGDCRAPYRGWCGSAAPKRREWFPAGDSVGLALFSQPKRRKLVADLVGPHVGHVRQPEPWPVDVIEGLQVDLVGQRFDHAHISTLAGNHQIVRSGVGATVEQQLDHIKMSTFDGVPERCPLLRS